MKSDSLLRHHFKQFGILVEIRAVLDRVHSHFDSHSQTFAAKRVAHYSAAALVRLIHQRFQLRSLKQHVLWSEPGGRACTTGSRGLNHIRACAHHLTHLGAHSFGTVRHAPGQTGVRTRRRLVAEWADPVSHASGWRNEPQPNVKPRTRHQTFVHRNAKTCVQSARVPHGRISCFQRLLQHGSDSQVARAARFGNTPATRNFVAERRQMVVRVDKPWHKRHPGGVDDLHTLWNPHIPSASGLHNGAVFNQQHRVRYWRSPRAVNHRRARECLHAQPS